MEKSGKIENNKLDFKSKEEHAGKFNWARETPEGDRIIKIIQKYLKPIAQSIYVKRIHYEKGGGSGKPQKLKISRKNDLTNPYALDLTVKLPHGGVHFHLTLKNILEGQIDEFIEFFSREYER
ncbi:MAG: hypothetical protein ACFFBD_08435 [Candidatus Hodarchaeota archaeon]